MSSKSVSRLLQKAYITLKWETMTGEQIQEEAPEPTAGTQDCATDVLNSSKAPLSSTICQPLPKTVRAPTEQASQGRKPY